MSFELFDAFSRKPAHWTIGLSIDFDDRFSIFVVNQFSIFFHAQVFTFAVEWFRVLKFGGFNWHPFHFFAIHSKTGNVILSLKKQQKHIISFKVPESIHCWCTTTILLKFYLSFLFWFHYFVFFEYWLLRLSNSLDSILLVQVNSLNWLWKINIK